MCPKLNKRSIKTSGLIITICLSVLIFICIFLVGLNYNEAHQIWINYGEWRHLAIVQITTVIIVFSVILLGFFSFTCFSNSKLIIVIFTIFNILSMIFTLSISIFSLVAGSIGKLEDYIGCNTKYQRIIQYWGILDQYLIAIDKELCTKCPCYISEYARLMFENDPFVKDIAPVISISNRKMINYQNSCSEYQQRVILSEIKQLNSVSFKKEFHYFDKDKFASYWKHIEEWFECSGWCTSVYQGTSTGTQPGQVSMVKYLFSNINKGIVKHRGCLKQILNWLPKLMLAYGSLTLIVSLLQVIDLVLALILLMTKEESKEAKVDKIEVVDSNDSYYKNTHSELKPPNN